MLLMSYPTLLTATFLFLIATVFPCTKKGTTTASKTTESGDKKFSYSGEFGPNHWAEINKNCGGKRQSPIDISLSGLKKEDLKEIEFSGYDKAMKGKMTNDGHGVKFTPDTSGAAEIKGGPYGANTYKFAQFHMHWGSKDNQGSEHTIDKKSFPLELHLVHMNSKYKKKRRRGLSIGRYESLGRDALGNEDGLAVIGIFFDVDKGNITQIIGNKVLKEKEEVSATITLNKLLPGDQAKNYMTYKGSLTTPPCSEAVTWVVLKSHMGITKKEMETFRKHKDSEGDSLSDNFRPVQPLNGRTVSTLKEKGQTGQQEGSN